MPLSNKLKYGVDEKELGNLDFRDAKRVMRASWEKRNATHRIDPSKTDSYTDGFWAARVWTLSRIRHLLSDEEYQAAKEALELV